MLSQHKVRMADEAALATGRGKSRTKGHLLIEADWGSTTFVFTRLSSPGTHTIQNHCMYQSDLRSGKNKTNQMDILENFP